MAIEYLDRKEFLNEMVREVVHHAMATAGMNNPPPGPHLIMIAGLDALGRPGPQLAIAGNLEPRHRMVLSERLPPVRGGNRNNTLIVRAAIKVALAVARRASHKCRCPISVTVPAVLQVPDGFALCAPSGWQSEGAAPQPDVEEDQAAA